MFRTLKRKIHGRRQQRMQQQLLESQAQRLALQQLRQEATLRVLELAPPQHLPQSPLKSERSLHGRNHLRLIDREEVAIQNLVQARSQSQSLGEPLHLPIQGLRERNIDIRKGQVTMIAAAPGAGKSMLTQALLHAGRDGQKNTVLYFSADSGPEVMHERAGALSTNLDQNTIREMVENGNTETVDAAIKAKHSHITYSFRGSPSQEYIIDELTAYVELHGRFPEVVVMDNLKDLADEEDADEFRALEDAIIFLKDLARDSGAAVIGLHHVAGYLEDGNQPIPLSGIRGKVSKTPALILTLYKPSEAELRISVVKNRNGEVDSSGGFWIPLNVDAARMRFQG